MNELPRKFTTVNHVRIVKTRRQLQSITSRQKWSWRSHRTKDENGEHHEICWEAWVIMSKKLLGHNKETCEAHLNIEPIGGKNIVKWKKLTLTLWKEQIKPIKWKSWSSQEFPFSKIIKEEDTNEKKPQKTGLKRIVQSRGAYCKWHLWKQDQSNWG